MTDNLFANIFFVVLLADLFWQLYLSWRQEKSVLTHQEKVPPAFSDNISLEEHQKAASYTVTKQRFGRLELVLSILVVYLWTLQGGLAWLGNVVNDWGLAGFVADLALLGLFFIISTIVSLPFSLYSTFVIEEKFGFNRSSVRLFVIDLLRSFIVSAVIAIPLLWVILWFMDNFLDNLWWLWVGSIVLGFQFIMMWVYPKWISPLFNKFTPLEDEDLKSKIQHLAQKCGFEATDIQVMDGSKRSAHGNAYFTGFGKSKQIVFFDTLLEKLSHSEVEAVLAHELGHYALKHIFKKLLPMVLMTFGMLYGLDLLIKSDWFYQAFGIQTPTNLIALLLFSLVLPPFTGIISPLFSYSSRKHEFEADAFAAKNASANDLISALLALYRDNAATLTPDKIYSMWHDSHPPASERISALEKLRHLQKVSN
jgi:STE24 endopeptidase